MLCDHVAELFVRGRVLATTVASCFGWLNTIMQQPSVANSHRCGAPHQWLRVAVVMPCTAACAGLLGTAALPAGGWGCQAGVAAVAAHPGLCFRDAGIRWVHITCEELHAVMHPGAYNRG